MKRFVLPLLFPVVLACVGVGGFQVARAQGENGGGAVAGKEKGKPAAVRVFEVEEVAKLAGVSVSHNDPAVERRAVEQGLVNMKATEAERKAALGKLPAGGTIEITVIRKGAEESRGKHFTVTVKGAGGKVLVENFKGPEAAGKKFAKGYECNFPVPLKEAAEYPVKVKVVGEGGEEGEWVVFEGR